jgi:hypothetical protein
VQKSNTRDFVQFAMLSLRDMKDNMILLLQNIKARQQQPLISFSDMRKLVDALSSTRNQQAVQSQLKQLQ